MRKNVWRLTGFLILFSCIFDLKAQYESDALLYSQYNIHTTARSHSMGGAFGALGGDAASMNINPAGLAFYTQSEFSFMPALHTRIANTEHYGTKARDSRANFNFGNMSYIGYTDFGNASKWTNGAFGISFSNLKRFNRDVTIQGTNPDNSLLDVFLHQAYNNGNPLTEQEINYFYPFTANLAWETYLLDFDSANYEYFIPLAPGIYDIEQKNVIRTSGRINEFALSFAAAYDYKWYVGGAITINNIVYDRVSEITEVISSKDTLTNLVDYSFREGLEIEGRGAVGLKLGVTYRALDFLRIGAYFHSPVMFSNMFEDYQTTAKANYVGFDIPRINSPIGQFNYRYQSPLRAGVGAAYMLKTYGLLSLDVEYINFSASRFRDIRSQSEFNSFTETNDIIRSIYGQALNIKAGTEWRVNNFFFRTGFIHNTNPYAEQFSNKLIMNTLTLGSGFRTTKYFIDWSYGRTLRTESYYLYSPEITGIQASKVRTNEVTIMIGGGVRF